VLRLASTFKTSADTRQCLFSNADACQRLKLVLTLASTFKTSADTRQCLFSNADACQRLKLVLTPIVP